MSSNDQITTRPGGQVAGYCSLNIYDCHLVPYCVQPKKAISREAVSTEAAEVGVAEADVETDLLALNEETVTPLETTHTTCKSTLFNGTHAFGCFFLISSQMEGYRETTEQLVCQMRPRSFKHAFLVIGVAAVLITSGCATAIVRSKDTVDPKHVYPATAFDGEFFWRAGVKGEPLMATVDPKDRNVPVARFAYAVGAIIDLPFSIVFDTILLPIDLIRLSTAAEDGDTEGEPDGPAIRSWPIRSETNRTSSAAGSLR